MSSIINNFGIKIHSLFSKNEPAPAKREEASQSAAREPETVSDIRDVSASVLASVTYKPAATSKSVLSDIQKLLKEHWVQVPEDFEEKFDKENAERHIAHLKMLFDI